MEALEAIEKNDAVRVVVLTGSGRAFSGGYDLGDIAARQQQPATQTARASFEDLANRIEGFPLPTICRLNGGVYGGSTDLALACDFRIGIESCEMLMPAARLGLHYYPSGIRRYVSRLGVAAAKKLFLTAQKVDAAEMLRIGYLDALVPAGELDVAVDALAAILAANAPNAIRGMKRAINEIARVSFDEDAARRRHQDSLRGEEIKEGIAAFAEKRKPDFTRG
jgi:enoyl-CoA hydratase/carnithine racemase